MAVMIVMKSNNNLLKNALPSCIHMLVDEHDEWMQFKDEHGHDALHI